MTINTTDNTIDSTANGTTPQRPRRGRPPRHDRSLEDTRALLIRSGLELFTEQGLAGSGLDLILRRVGVPKGSFYHYFASKEAFGLAVLDSYQSWFARRLELCFNDHERLPLQRLQNFVEIAAAGMARHDFRRGCLVGNLAQELGLLPDVFRQRLLDIFSDWQQRLALCLTEALECGHIRSDCNVPELADQFWICWEGAVSRARLQGNADPLHACFKLFSIGVQPLAHTAINQGNSPVQSGNDLE
jgi:TetR/AcrR family transcriptional regulator, transcriptional repressor for nem operon